jgi:hypothetical protein
LKLETYIWNFFKYSSIEICECHNSDSKVRLIEQDKMSLLNTGLYEWLCSYYAALTTKFTFYFANFLCSDDKLRSMNINDIHNNELIALYFVSLFLTLSFVSSYLFYLWYLYDYFNLFSLKQFVLQSNAQYASLLIQPPAWETVPT